MQIGENYNKKMMLGFRIDGGNFAESYNSFSVGFPVPTTSSMQILEDIKKTKKEENQTQQNYFDTLDLLKENRKRDLFEGLTLNYPKEPKAGEYHLSCMFETSAQSRCTTVILSKAPEESSRL